MVERARPKDEDDVMICSSFRSTAVLHVRATLPMKFSTPWNSSQHCNINADSTGLSRSNVCWCVESFSERWNGFVSVNRNSSRQYFFLEQFSSLPLLKVQKAVEWRAVTSSRRTLVVVWLWKMKTTIVIIIATLSNPNQMIIEPQNIFKWLHSLSQSLALHPNCEQEIYDSKESITNSIHVTRDLLPRLYIMDVLFGSWHIFHRCFFFVYWWELSKNTRKNSDNSGRNSESREGEQEKRWEKLKFFVDVF